jgi:hypothetical protein
MKIASMLFYFLFTAVIFISGCSNQGSKVAELKHFPVQNLDGVISKSNVVFDKEISSDGNGSIRITVNKPATIMLYETGDIDAENARLTYRAKVRTEVLKGKSSLKCCVSFPAGENIFPGIWARRLPAPMNGQQKKHRSFSSRERIRIM